MNSYSNLVQKILQVPSLTKQVESLAADQDALNLITKDWKKVLVNHKPFQDFQNKTSRMFQRKYKPLNSMFSVQNLQEDAAPLSVIVAGHCRMYKPYKEKNDLFSGKQPLSVVMSESNVMDMMIKAITNDLDPKYTFVNPTCKLNLKTCSMFCQYCSKAREEMTAYGIPMSTQYLQPCISDTLVFDGQSIANRFGSQIMNSFSGEFISIIKMELNVRYFYSNKGKECVRVGGSIEKMICFPESNLKEVKIELGNLNAIATTNSDTFDDVAEKRSLNGDYDEEDNFSEPCEKKQKTWEDEYDVTEDTLNLE